jgi:hypothetical protein
MNFESFRFQNKNLTMQMHKFPQKNSSHKFQASTQVEVYSKIYNYMYIHSNLSFL